MSFSGKISSKIKNEYSEANKYYSKNKRTVIKLPAIVSLGIIIWFLVSIGMLILLGKSSNDVFGYSIIAVSQMFAFGGLLFMIGDKVYSKKATNENKKTDHGECVIMTIGFMGIIVGILQQLNVIDLTDEEIIILIPPAIFALASCYLFSLFVHSMVQFILLKSRCTSIIDAECVEIKVKYPDRKSERSGKTYCPVYRIYAPNGPKLLCDEIYLKNRKPNISDMFSLHINPDNFCDFYDKRRYISDIITMVSLLILSLLSAYGVSAWL